VAEEHSGALWAVQAKLYDPVYAIKKSDLDSFLSESGRGDFAYRLLIATTDRLGPTARKVLNSQRQPTGYVLRSQLELAPVVWPASPRDLRRRRPEQKKPFHHVREAVKETIAGFSNHDRGQLIMACGTGKTLTALWIAERLESSRTLVLVPSLSLLAQTLREWSANASEPFEYLAVCSDATVVGQDDAIEHTSELGLPVTTEPDAIAAFLRHGGRRVVFATYHSSPQVAAAFQTRTPAFDLAIADEAHRCAGRVAGEFATILDADRIRARRRLFMTATPRYFTPSLRHEARLLDVEVASMDDLDAFGPVLHRLTFAEAINRKLLSDYQVAVVGVDDATYRRWAERGELVTRDGDKITDARTLAGQIALAKAIRKYDLRRVISFHGRVKAARSFSAETPQVIEWMPPQARPRGRLWSEHVNGTMTSGQRDRLLLQFRTLADGQRGLLSNARCLAEGVDVPTIDGVAFIDPKHSTVDIIQAVGRAIRKAPDKRVGTIVVPVFLGHEDPDTALADSSFRNVWDILKALRAHDETLGEELDEIRRSLGARRVRPKRPGKIKLDVPAEWVGAAFADAFDTRLVEATTASWQFWFGLLQRFVARERHSRPRADHREDGHRLGGWVTNQVQQRRAGRLLDEYAARLEALPGWTWTLYETRWDRNLSLLAQFAEREGHASPPQTYVEDAVKLGLWVVNQRQACKRGKLSDDQRHRLEALRGWKWEVIDEAWELALSRLRQYVEREGNVLVPQGHREDGFGLGSWVAEQRQRKREEALDDRRQADLESVPGWAWDKHEATWMAHYEALQTFTDREGHARVHQKHVEGNLRLGGWVANQRNRAEGLSDTQRSQLEVLPGWTWRPLDESWERGADALRSYVAREGDSSVPLGHCEDAFGLGAWVAKRRALYRSGKLSEQQIRWLEARPGWSWDPRTDRWERGFEALVRYTRQRGSATPPPNSVFDRFRLGTWVVVNRTMKDKGKLSAERQHRLESLPGWLWNPNADIWENGFFALEQYVRRVGNANPPKGAMEGESRVAQWVSVQRSAYKRGKIDPVRASRLERLPGWVWDANEAAWWEKFELLRAVATETGSASLRFDAVVDGVALGSWIDVQRQYHRKAKLREDHRRLLEDLPGWEWAVRDASWEQRYRALQSFAEQTGHSSPASAARFDGVPIGPWVVNLRQSYRKGRLSANRIAALEQLPGWLWAVQGSQLSKG
jgi:superfamily II DNA or RNA helicase